MNGKDYQYKQRRYDDEDQDEDGEGDQKQVFVAKKGNSWVTVKHS